MRITYDYGDLRGSLESLERGRPGWTAAALKEMVTSEFRAAAYRNRHFRGRRRSEASDEPH